MTNILSHLIILFLFFSCSAPNKPDEESKHQVLETKSFIPELSGKLNEISGIMIYDDLYWGFNDSGGKNKLYGFDKEGKIKKELEFEKAKNQDWESITQDQKNIYIGDFGNNSGARDDLCIYKIKKKDIKKKKEQKVEAKKIRFKYATQQKYGFFNKSTPFDCEAMVEFKGNLYLFSKNWKDRTSTVYKIPTQKGEYEIHPMDTFNVKGLITGADISPDKTKLALLGYENYQSFMWIFSDFTEDDFYGGSSQLFKLNKITNAQTEGISFNGNDSVLISCERTWAFNQQVFLVELSKIQNGAH